jgi:hypothetical protein
MVQMFPFPFYRPAESALLKDDVPVVRRDPIYYHAVRDHIQTLVMAKP